MISGCVITRAAEPCVQPRTRLNVTSYSAVVHSIVSDAVSTCAAPTARHSPSWETRQAKSKATRQRLSMVSFPYVHLNLIWCHFSSIAVPCAACMQAPIMGAPAVNPLSPRRQAARSRYTFRYRFHIATCSMLKLIPTLHLISHMQCGRPAGSIAPRHRGCRALCSPAQAGGPHVLAGLQEAVRADCW